MARLAIATAPIERFGASADGLAIGEGKRQQIMSLAAACGVLVSPPVTHLLLSHGADPMAGKQPALDALACKQASRPTRKPHTLQGPDGHFYCLEE